MRTIVTLPSPIGAQGYFDKIPFWLRKPLDEKTLLWLTQQCGKGELFVADGSAPFRRGFCQRVELRQPSEKALRWLAKHNDALVNRAEIALDLVFKYQADTQEVWDYLHRHLVRRWHGRNQEIRVRRSAQRGDDPGSLKTRYDAGRRAPNLLVLYAEDHSRKTGELNCLHIEWRVKSLRAMRAAGINSGQDLPNFDHRAFWQKRLLLYTLDSRRLGRLYRNRVTGKRRRTPEIRRSLGTPTILKVGQERPVPAYMRQFRR
jgi:hypothetical protein